MANTKWVKWCIAGTNGTIDYNSAYAVGIDVSAIGQDFSSIGTTVGSNDKTISKANLPAEGLKMFTGNVNTGGGGIGPNDTVARARSLGSQALNYEIVPGTGSAALGVTSNMGSGTALNIQPKSRVSVYVVKIVE